MNSYYRWFLKQCVAWWADEEQPRWLRDAVRRDPQLRQTEQGFNSLGSRLRRDAVTWRAAETKAAKIDAAAGPQQGAVEPRGELPAASVGRSPRATAYSRATRVGWSTAAAVLIVIGLRWQAMQPEPSPVAVESVSSVAVEQVNAELQALARVYQDSMRGIESSVVSVSTRTQGAMDLSNVASLRAKVTAPVASYSRAYGRALALLAKSAVAPKQDVDPS